MRDWKYKGKIISTDELYTDYHTKDTAHGFSAKLTSKIKNHSIVGGIDYDNGVVHLTDSVWGADNRARTSRWAVYLNDTIDLGKLAITPGIRFDHDNTINDFISPSLGLTYAIQKNTILRASVARGFNSPPSLWSEDTIPYGFKGNPDLRPEKVWSYQLGVETGALKYVWLKVSAFRHDIENAVVNKEIVADPDFFYTYANGDRLRRQGLEAEIRTLPFYHCVLSAGATYLRIKDLAEDKTVRDYPNRSFDLSLKYDDEKSLKALLTGHYVWWDSTNQGNYRGMLVDFNIMKRIFKQEDREASLFFTAHNIFDAEHHVSSYYRYPDRWLEAGIRFKF
jgi:vitamin B12 transporter